MATITAYGKIIPEKNWINGQNIIDTDDNTYGSLSVAKASSESFVIRGFDFSEIPEGSTINKITFSSKADPEGYIYYNFMCTRRYENGVFVEDKSTYKSRQMISGSFGLDTFSTSDAEYVGTWTRDELCNGSAEGINNYSGIGFYLTVKNSASSASRAIKIYFVKVTVDYTLPKYTITTQVIPNGAGIVSGGGTFISGATVTLTATPADGYQFNHWHPDNSTNPIKTFSATGNQTWTAIFESDSKIYNGTTKVQKIYLGTTPIKKIYIGTTQIF